MLHIIRVSEAEAEALEKVLFEVEPLEGVLLEAKAEVQAVTS